MRNKKKIIRAATVPMSLSAFLDDSIETMMEKYELVLVSSPDKVLFELQEQYGMKVVGVPMERHISATKDLKSLMQLIKVLRKEKPIMVHSMTPKAGLLCMMAAWICRVPRRVHTFTGLVWPTATGLTRKILMATDWVTCACATHIVPEGEGVKNDLQNHITNKPMKVLGYGNVRGVDMEYWSLRPEVKVKAERLAVSVEGLERRGVFTFLFVGRIVGDKGINELVEAFVRLLAKYSNIRLFLVGPYEENLDPVKQITLDRINSISEISAVGDTHGEDLLAYYAASDCFVFPSYREGFPNTVLEAGAMGLPQIVTDINGSREIICDNFSELRNLETSELRNKRIRICKNGIIVPSKDVDALYCAMERMIESWEESRNLKTSELRDSNMYLRMKENARPMIESRFEQKFVQKCLFDFYDEIMK